MGGFTKYANSVKIKGKEKKNDQRSPAPSGIQTLDMLVMTRVFHHFATTAAQIFFFVFASQEIVDRRNFPSKFFPLPVRQNFWNFLQICKYVLANILYPDYFLLLILHYQIDIDYSALSRTAHILAQRCPGHHSAWFSTVPDIA